MNQKKLMLLIAGLTILIVFSGVASFYLLSGRNKDKIQVACVGDSITEGTSTHLNFDVAAKTLVGFDWLRSLWFGKPYMNENVFQEAKAFQPNVVVIMLGTNDAYPLDSPNNETFVEDYIKLVEAFQTLSTKPKIYIVKPPPVFSNATGLNPEYFRTNVIPAIEQAAKQTDLPMIDVYSALANSSNFFRDGVHPNAKGAKLIADEIYRAIT
jgi:lysophospholipase L1-like esterase